MEKRLDKGPNLILKFMTLQTGSKYLSIHILPKSPEVKAITQLNLGV